MAITSPLILVTPNVAYPLATRGSGANITGHWCASFTLRTVLTGAPSGSDFVYVGLPPPLGASSTVSSIKYDGVLYNDPATLGYDETEFKFGEGSDEANTIDLSLVYVTSPTANLAVAIAVRQV